MLASFLDGRVFGDVPHPETPPRCLALHGWGRSSRDFAGLSRAVPTLAVDLPGFGASPQPETVWGSVEYSDLLTPILQSLARPRVLVGHSFGGRVALQLAYARPDLVDRLVLTGVPLLRTAPPRRPSVQYRLLRRLARTGVVGQRRLEEYRQRHGSPDYRAASGVMRDVLVRVVNEDYRSILPQITVPAALVWGGRDREVPLAVAEQATALMPKALLHVCGGAEHAIGPLLEACLIEVVAQSMAGE